MSHEYLTLGEAEDFLDLLPDGLKASDTQATSLLHFKSVNIATDSESLGSNFHVSLNTQSGVCLKLLLIFESLEYLSFYRAFLNYLIVNKELLGEDISACSKGTMTDSINAV